MWMIFSSQFLEKTHKKGELLIGGRQAVEVLLPQLALPYLLSSALSWVTT